MLDNPSEVLTTMAGSFGYAAPEVMLKKGHGKAVDMWSLGVITYTLLCGYSPFRSENLNDLISECQDARIIFHERYWRDVSIDAKNFILDLLEPDPSRRPTSQQALKHTWLKGDTATDHNLLPELRAYMAKARLKRGIEIVKLANRIEALKMQEEDDDIPGVTDLPSAPDAHSGLPPSVEPRATTSASEEKTSTSETTDESTGKTKKRSLSKIARGAIFREVVLAKVKEMKQKEQQEQIEREAKENAEKRKSDAA